MSTQLRSFIAALNILFFTGFTLHAQTADFSITPSSGCAPLTVSFTDNSTGAITGYSWNLGNGNPSTLQNPSATYANPGPYIITLTVSGPGGSSTKIDTVIVYDKPSASFSAITTAGCAPLTTQFSANVTPNAPGNVSYYWDFGDGTTDTTATPAHSYTTPGTYNVSLTVTNGAGCTKTFFSSAYITVYQNPVADFTGNPISFCGAPASVSFTSSPSNGTPPYSANWAYGDAGTGTGNSSSHVYTSGGAFTVSITVTDAHGCPGTHSKAGYVSVNTTLPSFSGPSALCFGDLASFTNTTPDGANTTWKFGDGDSTAGPVATHFYAAGNYTVSMTTDINGCIKTATNAFTMNPLPANMSLGLYPPYPCPAPSKIKFTGHASNGISYVFKNRQDNILSTKDTFTKYYIKNGLDTVRLFITTAAGCLDSIVVDTIQIRNIHVFVTPGEGEGFPGFAGCRPLSATFGVALYTLVYLPPNGPGEIPYPLPPVTWSWNYGPGFTAHSSVVNHIYTSILTDTVKCVITTPNGCIDSGYRLVHADTPVLPSFYASPLHVCPHDTVTFYNTTNSSLSNLIFHWHVGERIITRLDTSRVRYPYQTPDTVYDVLLVSSNNGCKDSLEKLNYIAIHPPSAFFLDSIYCPPSLQVKFRNLSVKTTSQLWDFGDGTTDTSFNVSHTYSQPGYYHVVLTTYNSTFNCSNTFEKNLTVYSANIEIKSVDTALCLGEYLHVVPIFRGNGNVLYSWIFDGAQTPFTDSVFKAADHQYLTRGFHDVTLIISSGTGCLDTLTRHNYVLVSRPVVNFSASSLLGCAPLNVILHDASTNTPIVPAIWRRWIINGADTIYNAPIDTSIFFTTAGNRSIFLTVEDSLGCFDSLTRFNYISVRKPDALFATAKDSVCIKAPVVFNSSTTGTGPITHFWDFGDNHTDTGRHPAHIYIDTGALRVRLIVMDTVGCRDTLDRSLYVNSPHAGFTMSDSLAVCPPLVIQFTDTSSRAVDFRWFFGTGGGPVIIPNPINTFNNPGQYNIFQVAINSYGCTDTARSIVRVLGYNGGFTYSPTEGCAPMLVQFYPPATGIAKITWDFSDGNIFITNGTATSHTYLNAGNYRPRVIYSNGVNCSVPDSGLVNIRADRVNADFTWSVPCEGTPFSLTQSSTALYKAPTSWFWIFGGGDTAAGASPSYTYPASGLHAITLVAMNATGCKDTITRDVFVNTLPIIRSSGNKGLCPDDSTRLFATGGLSYQWSPVSLVDCPGCDTVLVHILPVPTWYYVIGTDVNGCRNKDSALVYIQLKTTDTTGPGGEICVGESIRLFAGGADHYQWLPAATLDNPHIATPLATPTRTTTYLLIAQEGTCVVDSVYVTVEVHSLPIFSAGNDETIVRGGAVTLHPTRKGISHIEWLADTTLSCWDCFLPNAHPRYTRTYYATGYNEYGCKVTDSVTVFVHCNGDLVFVPNTFSPNNDGKNDFFFPRGEGVDLMTSFRVFNRWGEMVFERNNLAINDERAGWDGTYKGQSLPPDVYVYTMQSRCEDGELVRWKGDITLMR